MRLSSRGLMNKPSLMRQLTGPKPKHYRNSHTAFWGTIMDYSKLPNRYLQLGRHGDIIAMLPALYKISNEKGHPLELIVGKDFASSVEGCSYIIPKIYEGDFRDIDKAMQQFGQAAASQVNGDQAVISQVYGHNYRVDNQQESFIKEMWRLAGCLELWRDQLPLVFDRRDSERENKLSLAILGDSKEPYVLYFCEGHSSPFPMRDILRDRIHHWFGGIRIIENPMAEKIHDLVGLMENATAIVTTDSAPMHLTAAVQHVPVVALIADTPSLWHGSPFRRNFITYTRYQKFIGDCGMITEELENFHQFGSKMFHVFSNYSMTGENQDRYRVARSTWKKEKFGVTDSHTVRDMDRVPFIRDIVRMAYMKAATDDTIIMLHNADTCFYEGQYERIEAAVRLHGACYSPRVDYKGKPRVVAHREENDGGEYYAGTDLFCFTKRWWFEHQHEYPDMILGREAWDRIMRELMRKHGAPYLLDTVYHFRHGTEWETNRLSRSNVHNQALAAGWLQANGIPWGETVKYP